MISRFCRYLDKVFQWSQRIQALSDPRPKPQISTQSAFLSAMMMSAAGLLGKPRGPAQAQRRLAGAHRRVDGFRASAQPALAG